jgi:hypothetical protein
VLFVCWAESKMQIATSTSRVDKVDDLILITLSLGEGF